MAMPLEPWEDWNALDWGDAFFRHFFAARETDEPVDSLPIGAEEIADAVAYGGNSVDALNAFVSSMRHRLAGVNLSLEADAARLESYWDRDSCNAPPFLSHLLLTCAIASEVSDTGADEDNFRLRLSGRLQRRCHSLQKLVGLWEAFAEWSTHRAHHVGDVRPLVLPSRGHLHIIGYSVRLAFPSRRDKLVIAAALKTANLSSQNLRIADVFGVIQPLVARNRLTTTFVAAFEEFRERYNRGYVDLSKHSFWRAVTEASRLHHRAARTSCLLVKEDGFDGAPSALVMMTRSSAESSIPSTYTLANAGFEVEGNDSFVTRIDGRPLQSVSEFADVADHAEQPHLAKQLRSGLLMFSFNDTGLFRAEASMPTDGTVDFLVAESKHPYFREFLQTAGVRFSERKAVFDLTEFAGIDAEQIHRRALPNWLKPILERSADTGQLQVEGGIRLAGGWLGRYPFLPFVRCPDDVKLSATPPEAELRRTAFNEWRFLPTLLDGRVVITARRDSSVVGTVDLRFWSDLDAPRFKPQPNSWWYAETFTPDEPCRTETLLDGLLADVVSEVECAPAATATSSDDIAEVLASALAARFTRKRSLSETEFNRILASAFAEWLPNTRRLVARAWVESWFVECLSNPRWSNRVYVPVTPMIVVHATRSSRHGRLLGLVTKAQKSRIRHRAEALGLVVMEVMSPSGLVPAILEFVAADEETLKQLASSEGMSLAYIASTNRVTADTARFSLQRGERPVGYEVLRSDAGASRKQRVEWHCRPDSPDIFVIYEDGEIIGWTRSRVYALFVGNDHHFGRRWPALGGARRDFLPLPLARLLTAIAPLLPSIDSHAMYRYPLLGAGHSSRKLSDKHVRRLEYLIRAARGEDGELRVPPEMLAALPPAIRAKLAGAAVPTWLLSEIMRLVNTAESRS